MDVLALPCPDKVSLRQQLLSKAITLADALDVPPDSERLAFARVAAAMANGFASALDLVLEPGALTAAELRRSAELIRTRYADPAWTRQR